MQPPEALPELELPELTGGTVTVYLHGAGEEIYRKLAMRANHLAATMDLSFPLALELAADEFGLVMYYEGMTRPWA